jgi:hypothetical protein
MLRMPVLGVVAAIALVAPARAQEPDTPQAFVTTYMGAMQSGDWLRVAGLMHPDALVQFKTMFGAVAKADSTGDVISSLFDVADAAEFDQAPPERVFSSFMSGIMSMSGDVSSMLSSAQAEFVGQVEEPARDLTHVLYRMSMDMAGVTVQKVEVLALKRHDGRWRAMLSGDVEGMAAALMQLGGR